MAEAYFLAGLALLFSFFLLLGCTGGVPKASADDFSPILNSNVPELSDCRQLALNHDNIEKVASCVLTKAVVNGRPDLCAYSPYYEKDQCWQDSGCSHWIYDNETCAIVYKTGWFALFGWSSETNGHPNLYVDQKTEIVKYTKEMIDNKVFDPNFKFSCIPISTIFTGDYSDKCVTGGDQPPLFREVGNLELGKLLVDQGADVNAKDGVGKTPLMYAAGVCNNTQVLELLLDHGANVTAQDGEGLPALYWSMNNCGDDQTNMVFLLDHGADPNFLDVQGVSSLYYTTSNEKMTDTLIRYGATCSVFTNDHFRTECRKQLLKINPGFACNSIENTTEKDNCITKGAQESAFFPYCANVQTPSKRFDCYASFVPSNISIGDCKNISTFAGGYAVNSTVIEGNSYWTLNDYTVGPTQFDEMTQVCDQKVANPSATTENNSVQVQSS